MKQEGLPAPPGAYLESIHWAWRVRGSEMEPLTLALGGWGGVLAAMAPQPFETVWR